MDIQDIKKKTASVSGLITLISSIVAVAFLLTPKATILFGIIAIISCSVSAGFCFGSTYAERLLKKGNNGIAPSKQ